MRRIAAILIACFFATACASVLAAGPMRFTETPGAKAFAEERFANAVAEFEKLLQTNPDNTLVLRYLAMSYDRVGRFADALRTYATALQKSPQNVALLYHSGETLYRAHYADDARRHFRLVLEWGPNTEYARYAQAYLDALAQQTSARQSPGAPRRFGVFLEIGAQRDEYDVFAADGVTRQKSETDRVTEYLSIEWYLLRRADWVANLELSGYGAQYVGDADGRKDLWQYAAGGLLQRSGKLGRVPLTGSLRGSRQWVRFDGGPDYSESSMGMASLQMALTKGSKTRVYYRYTDDDFEADGFDPAYSSRDAEVQAGGLQHTAYFLDRKAWLTLGAEFQENDAEGLNFVFDGPQYQISLSVPLALGVRLDLGYEYVEEDYTEFQGPVARETTRDEWSGTLSRWFGRSVLARLNYREVDEDSTIPSLSYERRGYGVSVAYVY